MTSNYFHLAHGFILVYALNNKQSFNNLLYWLNIINETNGNNHLHLVILGNKSDLKDEQEISQDEIQEKKSRLGIDFFETCATKRINIEESMENIITKIHKSIYEQDGHPTHGISIEKKGYSISQSKSKCCKN